MDVGAVVGGRYEIVHYIGGGGMGRVWRGFDQTLDRHVAIKVIRADAYPDEERHTEAVARFRREARMTARIRHPGVPIVYDVGTHEGRLYLVLELVDGYGVHDLIPDYHPLPIPWVAAIGAQVCAVLTVTHAASLIHRDLKPNNLVLCPDGMIKVLDFGIAAVLGASDITKITREGDRLGTPCYMAPELAVTGAASAQSDLYALGCVLHELAAGTRVFESAEIAMEMGRHYSDAPPPLRTLRPDVPEEIERLVLRLLAKDPAERPAGAAAVYEILEPFVEALPALPGATAVAPSPDPFRMYATVVGRIAESALAAPRVPERRAAPPARRISEAELLAGKERAGDLAVDGRFSQAVELLETLIISAEMGLPTEHQLLFALRMDLANALFAARRFDEASPVFDRLIPELAAHLPEGHRVVLECRFNRALCMAGRGLSRAALHEMTALLPDMNRSLPDREPLVLDLRREIGVLHVIVGDPATGKAVLRALLSDMRVAYGDDHPETQHIRDLLANLDRLSR